MPVIGENYRSDDASGADSRSVSKSDNWIGSIRVACAHHDGKLDEWMLKPVRVPASFEEVCPFCIDMNSYEHESLGVNADEVLAL